MDLIKNCSDFCRQFPGRVVFPDSLDERAIAAVARLVAEGLAKPVLLGNPFAIRSLCRAKRLHLSQVPVVDPERSDKRECYADILLQRVAERGMGREQILESLTDPLWYGAMMVAAGDADYCVAGNLSSTSAVLRAALNAIGLAPGNKTVSSIFFMIAPGGGRALGFADCGVVPEPTPEQLADITISTAESYRTVTGSDPAVGLLSFSSRGSAKHPVVEKVRAAVSLVRQRCPGLVIDGELQFDAAYVPSVAMKKVPDSPLAGSANVFIFPSLEAGNIGYKIAERLGGYAAVGPLIQGLQYPMHDLSRGCSVEDIIDVTLVANKMARGQGSLVCSEQQKSASGLIGVNPQALDRLYASKRAVHSF
ncbi:MAG: phosphate acetyltransferase [Dechloromonas sp.]|nr:phosphate acetyltransferase [Dechloromonas sp.]